MSAMAPQITSVLIASSIVCSGLDQRKHQSSASLAFVRGFHRWPVDSLQKGPVTRKMFPFEDVIMINGGFYASAFRRRRHYVFGLSVRLSVRPKPEIPSFDLYMGPLVHSTNRNHFTACPSVRPSVRLSVRPSREVSGHLPENAWREWPEILHAGVSWLSSELISLWPRSVDFCNFDAILT